MLHSLFVPMGLIVSTWNLGISRGRNWWMLTMGVGVFVCACSVKRGCLLICVIKYSAGIDLNRVFKVLTFLRGSRSLSPHPALVLVLELEYKVLFGDILIFLALDADSCPAKCKSESKVKKPSYH